MTSGKFDKEAALVRELSLEDGALDFTIPPRKGDAAPPEQWPAYDRKPDHFLIGSDGAMRLFKDIGARAPGVLYDEVGRGTTRERTPAAKSCTIQAFFGLAIHCRDGSGGWMADDLLRFSAAQPELALSNNGKLGVRIRVTNMGEEPGTLNISVTRSAPGTTSPPPRTYSGSKAEVLEQIRKADEISLEAPPGMNANKEGRVVVETIAASVSWTPKDAPSCSITPPEQFILRWEYTNPLARSRYRAAEQKADGNSRTRVSHGTSLVPVLDGNGKPLLAVRVQAFFAVDDAGHCCGAEGDYSVIQWVRHEWNLKENPVKAGGDDWSLDVLDSEIQRAAASQPYDPTFTHNPRGTQPAAEPLTYPGPDPDGNLSINQIDRPGIPAALYDRFQRANPNSTFTFHFVAMLVCRQDPSTAQGFRNSGHVKAIIEYKLVIKFNGRGTEPQVTLEKPSVSAFDSCKEFNKVLEQFDRQARNAKQGSPIAGYEHPRDHKLAIPK